MSFARQVLLSLRLIKLRRFWGSLFYPLQRDWLERRSRPQEQMLEVTEETGAMLRAQPTARGARFDFKSIQLELSFLAPDLVRVDWQPGQPPIPYAIARQDWPDVTPTFQDISDAEPRWQVSTEALKIIVAADGALEFQDTTGQPLRQELPPQHPTQLSSSQGEGCLHQAHLRPEEQIYGLGERAAPLNLRTSAGPARTYRMWNYDAGGRYGPGTDPLYLCIPLYLGLHAAGSYLIFYENTHPATFRFQDLAVARFEGGGLRYYLMVGPPSQLLERYTELTGRPPLPPRWALGYHQSRWGYETEAAVRATAKAFQAHDLPLSAIHLDIDCQDRFRAFTIDPDRFPTLSEFTQELARMGVHLITIVNPGVKADRKSKLYQEGRAQDLFCKQANGEPILAPVWPGLCAFPDFTNPQARHWWSRQYEYLLDLGIAGFWHDMNEPGIFVLWGDPSLPQRSTQQAMEGRGGDHREAHNVYGLLQARAAHEALCEYQPQRRPFIVSRSGWAGLQRYAWTWTGDIETSWEGLRQTIPTVLNLGLSGIPYSGPDIGGFKGNPTPELYLRWFQMASFLPFCRTHSADNVKHRTPWSFGEPTLGIVRDFLKLRYRLLPYFYTLAWEATQTGHPLVRPLFWADRENPELWGVEDAFLLGEALLVCPVLEEGARSRPLLLPKGQWYHFWEDRVLTGQVELAAPLEQIPLLVKAGTVLPMEAEGKLVLHLYPPPPGESCQDQVYSDAGDGYGEGRLDQFHLAWQQNRLQLTWRQQGAYPFPYRKLQLHLHGIELQQAWVDGQEIFSGDKAIEVDRFERIEFQGAMT